MDRLEMGIGKLAAMTASLLLAWTAAVQALPANWIDKDIGAVGVAGNAAESGGLWSIYGSGADIWGTADAFNFAYQPLSGNTQVIAKINSVANTNGWAKAGVMIRQDLTAGSKNAFVALTPSNGVAFQYRAALNGSSLNANVAGLVAPYWVKLVRSGDTFTAYRSPDGSAWTQIGASQSIPMTGTIYAGLAATSHDNARLGSASAISVSIVNTPPPQGGVLFVAGSASLTSADAFIKRRLETLGHIVTVKAAASTVTADAVGRSLIVVSSTVASGDVGSKFSASAVPLITWENAILDDLGMTGLTAGTDYGTTGNQTQATVFTAACDRATMYTAAKGYADGCHDLAAGITGTFGLYTLPAQVAWGKPGANAIKIASQADNAAKVIEFAYDANAAMPGRAAPARRVFLFLSDLSAPNATGRALALFDNAVYWATNNKYSTVKKALLLTFSPILATQGNQRLHAYGMSHWGWNDPAVLAKDYLADLTEASGGYVRWKVANYAAIPAFLNTWGPITGSVQFNTPQFSEADYLNAYQYAITTGDWVGATARMPSQGNYRADYNALMDQYGVDAKVNAGEVDEVIVWGFPYSGYFESAMGGRTSYWINGTPFTRNTPNFFVMGFNYERTVGLAEHAFGHRAEQLIGDHAFSAAPTLPYQGCVWPDPTPECGGVRQPAIIRNIWDRFSVVEGNLPGGAGVGAIHWPPNVATHAQEYVYWSADNYYSQADDWLYNYPVLQGASTRRLLNVNEWTPMAQDGESQRGFVKWYYQHYPRFAGKYVDASNASNNNRLNNWWEYVVNYNNYAETRQ
ncbi:MAG: hypothetical protein JWP91_4486 [Fibrobacteres bacterium]|nr:hypothetical protein [Fibrobacterota bacterium]